MKNVIINKGRKYKVKINILKKYDENKLSRIRNKH